jgi:hypothetical protein
MKRVKVEHTEEYPWKSLAMVWIVSVSIILYHVWGLASTEQGMHFDKELSKTSEYRSLQGSNLEIILSKSIE